MRGKDKLKLFIAFLATLGGWGVTLSSWSSTFQTPAPLAGLLILLAANLGGALGITSVASSKITRLRHRQFDDGNNVNKGE